MIYYLAYRRHKAFKFRLFGLDIEIRRHRNEAILKRQSMVVGIGRYVSRQKFLFCRTEHFSTYLEFCDFYGKNRRQLVIIDQFSKEIPYGDFLELVNYHQNKKSQTEGTGIKIFKDEFGFEFTDEQLAVP